MAITREQIKAANKRGSAAIARGPVARAARYDARRAEGAFGSRRWMQHIDELGSSARSAGKAKAAREYGTRGGRPKDEEAA